MIRFRRRRLRVRIVLIAIVALLWSQLVLARHADCLLMAAPAAVLAVDHGCDGPMPSFQQPVCAAHCSHGDVSADSGRVPPVPPMLAAPGIPLISVAVVASDGESRATSRTDRPPPVSWHRPTAHPAALLLI
jgi:hypothetical protein